MIYCRIHLSVTVLSLYFSKFIFKMSKYTYKNKNEIEKKKNLLTFNVIYGSSIKIYSNQNIK